MNIAVKLAPPPMEALAATICAGNWRAALSIDPRIGYDDRAYYTHDDWRSAAEEALEGDHTDLALMLHREDQYQDYIVWQRVDYAAREDYSFEYWRERVCPEKLAGGVL